MAVGLLLSARASTAREATVPSPAETVLSGLGDPVLRSLVGDVLERNPSVAESRARARAARLRAPQAAALPDPMTGVTGYVLQPQTRVGPLYAMVNLSQKLPWFGKLGLREKAALSSAAAQDALVEALRLDLLTETRRLYYEIGFLDAHRKVVQADQTTLQHYEELARTRYITGAGLEQAVIKIQAEITKDDTRLLDIANRRATLVASLNALRDRPRETEIPPIDLPVLPEITPDASALRARALALRPEVAQADAEIVRAGTLVDLSREEYKPDVTLGLTYGIVGNRTDAQGIASPPPDNGSDDFGISAGLNLPIWGRKLRAGVQEAMERRLSAEEGKRGVVTGIDRTLGELVPRVSLTWDQLHLFQSVLAIQADQSLRSAESGYSAGTLNSLDLLDAERVLLEVRIATERARADYAIALARLEGAVGEPLFSQEPGRGGHP
ncbi:MAG: TolC family protein [Acidithiobacillales bacterium]